MPASPTSRAPRPFALVLALLALAVATPPATAQEGFAGAAAESYRRGRAVVERGLETMGGAARFAALEGVEVRIASRSLLLGQERSAEGPEAGLAAGGVLVADLRGGRVAREWRQPYHGGYLFASRTVVAGDSGATESLTRIGPGPYVTRLRAGEAPNARAGLLWDLPHVVLQEALSRPQALRWLGEAAGEGGETLDVVTFVKHNTAQVALLFRRATGELARYESLSDHPVLGDVVLGWAFPEYREVEGMRFPARRVLTSNGRVTQEDAYEVRVNPPPKPSRFAFPAAEAPVAPDSASSAPVRALGEGVWLLQGLLGSWNALAVDLGDHVVVVEAPGSPEATAEALRRIATVAPGKPVRTVVMTHHHADHSGGLRAYLAEGATALVPAGDEAFVRRLAAAPRTIRPDALSRAPREPVVEGVDGRRELSGGGRRLVLLPAGPNAHAEAMLLAWLPESGTLFQADLLILPERGVAPGIAANRELLATLRRLRLEPRLIAGVHGRTATMAELEEACRTPPAS